MKKDVTKRLQASRSILVIKLRYVGDCIWTLPFLENLKGNLPHARITVVAPQGADTFFQHNGYVDQVIPYPNREIKKGGIEGARAFLRFLRQVRRVRAEVAIELSDSDKAAAIAFLSGAATRIGYRYFSAPRQRLLNHLIPFTRIKHWVAVNFDILEALGLRVLDRDIHNATPPAAFDSLRQKCPSVFIEDGRKKIVVHPGARMLLRQWGSARFARLCDVLAAEHRVILTAGPDEKGLLDEVVAQMESVPECACCDLGLQEFAALCEEADLFVGNDSGPIHIAATKTFTVGIYGPNCDEFAGPWRKGKYVFEDATLSCRETCSHLQCTHESHHACMTCTTVDAVAAKVNEVLGAAGGAR